MNFSYIAVFAWLTSSLIAPAPAPARESRSSLRVHAPTALVLGLLCCVLCASFAVSLVVLQHAAAADPYAKDANSLPMLVLNDTGAGDPQASNWFCFIAVIEGGCLFAVYRLLRGSPATRATVAILGATFVALAALAMWSPASNSSDLYGYVAFAMRPEQAYLPLPVPFGGDHASIDILFGVPRKGAWYGPLWIWATHVLLVPVAGLAAQLAVLRALEVGALAACIAVLRALKAPFAVLAIFAANPALFGLWVVDGHNDLLGVALLLTAFASRVTWVRVALVAAAGLIKLPLVVVGALIFSKEKTLLRRVGLAVAALVPCLALSWVLGGPVYLNRLLNAAQASPLDELPFLHVVGGFVALAVLAAAVFARRYTPGGAFIWRAFGSFPAPWYAIWGLPYAYAAGALPLFLIVAPIDGYLFSWNYAVTGPELMLKGLAFVGPLVWAIERRRRARLAVVGRTAFHDAAV